MKNPGFVHRSIRLSAFIYLSIALLAAACTNAAEPLPQASATTDAIPVTTPEPSSTPITRILTYFIAGGDNGKSGKAVGCNDSVIPVAWDIPPSNQPMQDALEKLFSFKDMYVGPIQLYNSLYQSELSVESIEVSTDGTAIVHLSGTYLLGGVCDTPRFKAQIEETILQFPEIKQTEIYINDVALDDILSGK